MQINTNISYELNWFSNNSRKPKTDFAHSSNLVREKFGNNDNLVLSKDAIQKSHTTQKPVDKPDKARGELSEEEKKMVEELKERDRRVRSHEQAHIAAGGGLIRGGASFSYQVGPDGKHYAVGGEVQIDISPESTSESTIRKMQQVRRAALAPSDPSAQDRAVAATASKIESEAARELQNQRMEEIQENIKVDIPDITRNSNSNNNNSNNNNNNSNNTSNVHHFISPQAKLALEQYRKNEFSL